MTKISFKTTYRTYLLFVCKFWKSFCYGIYLNRVSDSCSSAMSFIISYFFWGYSCFTPHSFIEFSLSSCTRRCKAWWTTTVLISSNATYYSKYIVIISFSIFKSLHKYETCTFAYSYAISWIIKCFTVSLFWHDTKWCKRWIIIDIKQYTLKIQTSCNSHITASAYKLVISIINCI